MFGRKMDYMNLKKALSILTAVLLTLSVIGCNNKKKNNNTSQNSGGYTSNTESDYNNTVDEWKNSQTPDGGFDNTNENSSVPTPTPGSLSQGGIISTSNNQNAAGNTDKLHDFPASQIADSENLQYYHEGNNYAYGINAAGNEFIAFKSETGELCDILSGGGGFVLKSNANVILASSVNTVKSIFQTKSNSYDSLTVEYNITGVQAANTQVKTTYVFKENGISLQSEITSSGKTVISSEKSAFTRNFINGFIANETKISEKWEYPSNGDYPYPDFDSLCFKNQITNDIYCYSYLSGDDIDTFYNVNSLDGTSMPLNFENSTGLKYTVIYDLAFVDTLTENRQGSDYLGIFKARGSDFAAGIASVEENHNSTFFTGNEVKLNINVTNLTNEDLKFSLRYDIRDYYGNIVNAGLFIDSTVYKYVDANRIVTVKPEKYGIYYLNLYVISRYSSYKECYPFALLNSHEYKYNATNPFGIVSTNTKNEREKDDTAHIMAAIGVATYRSGGDVEFLKKLKSLGLSQFNAIIAENNIDPAKTADFVKKTESVIEKLKDYVDSYEVGNEMNIDIMRGKYTTDELYPLYYKNSLLPTYNLIKSKYPNIKYIPSPFSDGQQEWIEKLTKGFDEDNDGDGIAETHIDGFWDKIDVVSTHTYGTPYMPDEYGQYKPKHMGGAWCIEGALQRIDDCLTRLCKDKTEKDLYITEVGYATSPGTSNKIDLRTQADYLVRCGILCSAYGADRIQFYCMYDRPSYGTGFDHIDDEWNFGVFYEADYYGVFKPKPSGVAFAAMTRILESMEKNSTSIYQKYDEGYDFGGVRAFKCSTAEYGNVIVAYSNNEILNNAKKNAVGGTGDRTPTLPWNNQWTKTDDTVFETNNKSVTVFDIMGNKTEYKASDGKVTIPLTGSPVYIIGAY